MDQDLNRVEQLWYNWEEKQQQLEHLMGTGPDSALAIQQRKYDFMREGLYRLSAKPTEKEKLFLHAITLVTARLHKQLYPNRVARLIHLVKAVLYDKPMHLRQFEKQKQESVELLKHKLNVLGLGSYTGKLENFMDYESRDIAIAMTTQLPEKGTLDVLLHLERNGFGQYRFHDYHATVSHDGLPIRTQTFYADTSINAREAVNLLEGRAVRKSYEKADGSISHKWLQLDFGSTMVGDNYKMKEFHTDYDLKKEIVELTAKIGVTGLSKEKLLQSMEQGNQVYFTGRHPVNEMMYLEANPGELGLLIRNQDQNQVHIDDLIKIVEQSKKPEVGRPLTLIKQKEPEKGQGQSITVN